MLLWNSAVTILVEITHKIETTAIKDICPHQRGFEFDAERTHLITAGLETKRASIAPERGVRSLVSDICRGGVAQITSWQHEGWGLSQTKPATAPSTGI